MTFLRDWETIVKLSNQILLNIFKDDSAFLIFHDDADGCCAAAILLNLVATQSTGESPDFASPEKHSVELTRQLTKKLRERHPKFIVSLDLALPRSPKKIAALLPALHAQMLIYDHHIQSRFLDWPENCIHINPLNMGLGNIPASYYSYILSKRYTNLRRMCWVAAVGVVHDYRVKECKDLLEEVRGLYPSLYPFEAIDQPTALRSPLMAIAHLVNAGYQHSDGQGAKLAVEALNEALSMDDPTTLLEGKTRKALLLHRFRREVDDEINRFREQFEFDAEFHAESQIAFYSVDPKFNITSQLATQLQHSYPNTIIAVMSPEAPKKVKASLRRGSNVETDLAALAESTTARLAQASGGGHPDASGCTLRTKDVFLWKRNMLQYIRKTS
ncbi:MAG: hypothetical protein JSW72_06475 [Candidatus Bathyarchaeota archaeon]|nr:MAG: hypothetical protein JSW72_06475 [Candidatus Bathyarchaeota archaeon]